MQIYTSKEKDNLVMEVQGRLDAVTSGKLEEEVKAGSTGRKRWLMDLGGVDYISSAGLRAILILARKLNGSGGADSLLLP